MSKTFLLSGAGPTPESFDLTAPGVCATATDPATQQQTTTCSLFVYLTPGATYTLSGTTLDTTGHVLDITNTADAPVTVTVATSDTTNIPLRLSPVESYGFFAAIAPVNIASTDIVLPVGSGLAPAQYVLSYQPEDYAGAGISATSVTNPEAFVSQNGVATPLVASIAAPATGTGDSTHSLSLSSTPAGAPTQSLSFANPVTSSDNYGHSRLAVYLNYDGNGSAADTPIVQFDNQLTNVAPAGYGQVIPLTVRYFSVSNQNVSVPAPGATATFTATRNDNTGGFSYTAPSGSADSKGCYSGTTEIAQISSPAAAGTFTVTGIAAGSCTANVTDIDSGVQSAPITITVI